MKPTGLESSLLQNVGTRVTSVPPDKQIKVYIAAKNAELGQSDKIISKLVAAKRAGTQTHRRF